MKTNRAGLEQPQRVFIDTNIIIEAFRINCWPALAAHHKLETVQKCVEEALTGDANRDSHVSIKPQKMVSGLVSRHTVDKLTLATFALEHPECAGLDDGELHLLAWLKQNNPSGLTKILISTADKAAIVATHRLQWLDSVISLEELARQAGVARDRITSLAKHHKKAWLDKLKTSLRLG